MGKQPKTKDERRTTASDRSSRRMKQYGYIALALGLSLPFLVPLLFRLAAIINPPTYTEFVEPTPAQLHQIFFSGAPHLIFCTNKTGSEVPRLVKRVADVAEELTTNAFATTDEIEQQESLELTIDEKERAYKEGVIYSRRLPLAVGTLDCSALLPSGKSVLERFGLTLPPLIMPGGATPTPQQAQTFHSTPPLPPVFLIANGERPQWIPNQLFSKPDHAVPTLIVQHALPRITPKTLVLDKEKLLHSRCTSKKACVVILHSGASNLVMDKTSMSIRALQKRFPNVQIATIDVKKHTLDLQKNLGKLENSEQSKWPRLLFFRRQAIKDGESGTSKSTSVKDDKPDSTLFVKSYKGPWAPTDVVEFIENLSDPPVYASNGSLLPPPEGQKPKTSAMAVLKRAPILNYGQDNFKRPPKAKSAAQKKKEAEAARTQKQAQQQQQKQAAGQKAQTSAEKKAAAEREEREEREREERRRAQMEAEAAENFVQAAADEEDSEAGQAEEETDEEVVSLDEAEEPSDL